MLSEAPRVLELLAHPLRWALARSLARSDRCVGELVVITGERQNLVSYHLAQLRRAGLVVERHSSADARDVYYTLQLATLRARLDESAAALHPALRPEEPAAHRIEDGVGSRVLFVCSGNSARSLMAEAILRSLGGGRIDAHSAGPNPTRPHPLAMEVLESLGHPRHGLDSKPIEEVSGVRFDHVVTLCDIAREECPELQREANLIHWSLPDPAAVTGSRARRRASFEQTASELDSRIRFALPVLARSRPTGAAA